MAQNPFLTWNPLVDHPVSLRQSKPSSQHACSQVSSSWRRCPHSLSALTHVGSWPHPCIWASRDAVLRSQLPGSWPREPAPGMLPCFCAPASSPLSEFLRPQLFSATHTRYHPRSPFSSDPVLELFGSHITSVQSLSRVWLFVTPWTTAHQASLSITTNSWSLLKLMSIKSVMPSSHLILCYPLLLPPSIFSSIRVFSNESALCIRWPKYWSFIFSIGPSNEYSGLISFRMDWLDLLTVQGALKSLLQHHSSKASILRCSAFLRVQVSHPYMTTGNTFDYSFD